MSWQKVIWISWIIWWNFSISHTHPIMIICQLPLVCLKQSTTILLTNMWNQANFSQGCVNRYEKSKQNNKIGTMEIALSGMVNLLCGYFTKRLPASPTLKWAKAKPRAKITIIVDFISLTRKEVPRLLNWFYFFNWPLNKLCIANF